MTPKPSMRSKDLIHSIPTPSELAGGGARVPAAAAGGDDRGTAASRRWQEEQVGCNCEQGRSDVSSDTAAIADNRALPALHRSGAAAIMR